jgi:hypothetical protein
MSALPSREIDPLTQTRQTFLRESQEFNIVFIFNELYHTCSPRIIFNIEPNNLNKVGSLVLVTRYIVPYYGEKVDPEYF